MVGPDRGNGSTHGMASSRRDGSKLDTTSMLDNSVDVGMIRGFSLVNQRDYRQGKDPTVLIDGA